jgi:hypothetical protein
VNELSRFSWFDNKSRPVKNSFTVQSSLLFSFVNPAWHILYSFPLSSSTSPIYRTRASFPQNPIFTFLSCQWRIETFLKILAVVGISGADGPRFIQDAIEVSPPMAFVCVIPMT